MNQLEFSIKISFPDQLTASEMQQMIVLVKDAVSEAGGKVGCYDIANLFNLYGQLVEGITPDAQNVVDLKVVDV